MLDHLLPSDAAKFSLNVALVHVINVTLFRIKDAGC